MANALTRTLTTPTPQSRPLDERQVENSAGGYSYGVDKWARLRRFLILGTEGGTYYIGERDLTVENMRTVTECVAEDPERAVAQIVEVSVEALAPRNTQAIYALAVAASADAPEARQAANAAIGKVCRTGTHLFEFAGFMKAIGGRGWGRGLRTAVARIFETMPVDRLALHSVKYRQRDGWTHRDLMRLSHPKADTEERNAVFRWLASDHTKRRDEQSRPVGVPDVIGGFWDVNQADATTDTVLQVLAEMSLPWEAIPDRFRKDPHVMTALLESMPYIATMRNLSTFARMDLLKPMSGVTPVVVNRLGDAEQVKRSKVHPMQILDAMLIHGAGGRGGLSRGAGYTPNGAVLDVMNSAFHHAFVNVEPTGKRHYLALDVSGSMMATCAGSQVLSCRDGSAAMAVVTAAVEPMTHIVGFTAGNRRSGYRTDAVLSALPITGQTRLRDAISTVSGLPFGGTDCALPMLDALKQRIEADVFVVYTDSETWHGAVHPMEALRRYRKEMGIDAKLVVVGMTSNGFSIADPADGGAMDVVGFDASTPSVISSFVRGDIG